MLPLLIPCPENGADEFIRLISRECSAKEAIMATQEILEHLEMDQESDEAADDELWLVRQLVRVLAVYSLAIPRLPRRKKSPAQQIQPLLAELQSVMSGSMHSAGGSIGRKVLDSTRQFMEEITRWVNLDVRIDAEERKDIADVLLPFVISTLELCSNSTNGSLAQHAFELQYPRLVIPSRDKDATVEEDIIGAIWAAMTTVGLTVQNCITQPSLGTLMLLAHSPNYTFNTQVLTSFFPVILMSLQANMALDEVLSVLINAIVPLVSQAPRYEFPPDLIVPLAHVLPPLASVHPDPGIRHYTFRVLSAALALSTSAVRVQLLQGLLTDSDSSPQMRIAAIGLVKEALLEALATPPGSAETQRNMFASPAFLKAFGPIILRPDPPDLFTPGNTLEPDEFLDTKEPLRLVECLSLYYVLLLRDVRNRTGIRDKDNLRNAVRTLVDPLKAQLSRWADDSATADGHGHDSGMQLAILDMWLDRVRSSVEDIQQQ
ncbi:uncharacterized protein B0H18DRAFT_1005143 [Fomitopsis serialis]|uniref:uncharacterized protein n=1 Tax=Fomitopsis serialis TaxID=139415 RepID=UPI002008C16F|nr:uncharacterized protein B0H18DRAFT_1005143 [Neoantrodia serialis]KAH9926692.1 hypothetical protein B0H18DRAFT_1005143 [Neoantrodia serialis]